VTSEPTQIDNPTLVRINATLIIETPEGTTTEMVSDALLEALLGCVEARGWTLGGGFDAAYEVDEEGRPLVEAEEGDPLGGAA
jgi:hypothetical protein